MYTPWWPPASSPTLESAPTGSSVLARILYFRRHSDHLHYPHCRHLHLCFLMRSLLIWTVAQWRANSSPRRTDVNNSDIAADVDDGGFGGDKVSEEARRRNTFVSTLGFLHLYIFVSTLPCITTQHYHVSLLLLQTLFQKH